MAALAVATSATILGVEAVPVRIEVDIASGLPHTTIVGLPDAAVQEARDRVRVALRNSGLPIPTGRVLVNLAPADRRKEGPGFDLGIALAMLAALGAVPSDALRGTGCIGELALDGRIRRVRGTVAVALLAAERSWTRLIVPAANGAEATLVEGLEVWAPRTLREAVAALRGNAPAPHPAVRAPAQSPATPPLDLRDVKGQAHAKRALEIAAAGRHNLLLTGPPGTGKTMLAQRLPSILPPLRRDEALEATRIHSVAGTLPRPALLERPPFRAPHASASEASLIGGGRIPRPGEVSLAHRGVLYLDELPEFSRRVLEALRQPLEDGCVTVSRASARATFPASILFVASCNPCPCGFAGDATTPCRCTSAERERYRARISGPLLDRIDLGSVVARLATERLVAEPSGESSEGVRSRVVEARNRMLERQGGVNAELRGRALDRHARLDRAAAALARRAVASLALSARGYDRLRRVARTIADLAAASRVRDEHVAEAVAHRRIELA